MKAQKIIFSILLSLCLIFNVNSLAYTSQEVLHLDSEFPKVCTLKDGKVLVLSSILGRQQTLVTKLDECGNVVFQNQNISKGYSADGQLVQTFKSDDYLFAYHNKEKLAGFESKEKILTFKDKSTVIKESITMDSLYQKKSVVSLKNGNVIIAGIKPKAEFGAEAPIEINIYDSETLTAGYGFSFNAHSDYISCFEQKENNVYCVYVSYEDVFVSKLKIKHILVNGNSLENKGDQVIKAFYTEFNFLKAIRFNDNESLVLFQTGNGNSGRGNHGGNLFFYHLKLASSPFIVTVKRYEYLYPNCLYNKAKDGKHDPEYNNADIAVLSPNRIYAVCETSLNKFRGFVIYPDRPTKVDFDEFNFNNFQAENVQTPVFAKFGQSLGIFYTQITENYNKRVAFHIMNYPDCSDFRNSPILLPKHFVKELDFVGKVFLNNPYLFDRASEEVKVRFKSYSNITITDIIDNKEILPNVDYNPSLTLRFKSDTFKLHSIEYTAVREDDLDGLIVGKTCKVGLRTPECLDQCYSCTEKGTKEHHFCLGCVNDTFYEEEDPTAVNEGYGKPHFCHRCNISCSSCYGPFMLKPITTTNCKKCDYDNNYFHFVDDERTCISNETKKYWEGVIGSAIYLDKTPGEDKKHLWRWRYCHTNCAECFEKGDDVDNKCWKCKDGLYFWCNQTVGNGIPGSCHRDCVNNGFYETFVEDRYKCCECLDGCKECDNSTICNKCWKPLFLTPEHDRCNKSCGYCLAEDEYLGECVNCKTRYRTPKYTLNKTCVDEIPFIEFLNRYHHIVDDKCNLLHGCKEGCYKCSPWYSDRCTDCNASYYKEDFYGKPQPETFRCFNKTTCQGVTPYKHDESLRIGGVPVLESNINVCLNCKLRNNSYRLPENNFYCGPKIKRTYVDIVEYNKLSYCYFRCASCDDWGNSCYMNCTSCRDSTYYDLIQYDGRKGYGNCYRKRHKCGIYPYYHDYDLAESLGKDEDDCGEDCDVCLYNLTCTENFPFLVYETHECVEYCPMTDILKNACSVDDISGRILLRNPFGLKNPYDLLNNTVTLNQIYSSEIFKYIVSSYDVDINTVEKNINNYIGNGKVYNLPESKIIVGNNISIELTSVKLELEKLTKLLSGDQSVNKNISTVDLSACQTILKKKYGLPEVEDLLILKGDLLQKISEQYLSNEVDYQLFSSSLGAFLPLKDCKDAETLVKTYNPLNTSLLTGLFQFKTASAIESGYNPFDMNSSFYHDICTPFTNENGNDVLLDERRTDYFNENNNLCEKGCQFLGYNETIGMYTCNCPIKSSIGEIMNYEETPMEIPEDFYKKESGYSNIKVFKCSSQVFSSEGQKKNFGSYILLACFVSFIAMVALYFIKGKQLMEKEFFKLSVIHGNKNSKPKSDNTIPANPPKPVNTEKLDYDDFVVKKDDKNAQADLVLNEEELNSADYTTAKNKDTRSFIKYYWSLLKMRQLCIFTFYTYTDHNSRIVKIALFILFLSFYFAFTALFFNDSIMRAIYIYKGNTDAAVHVTNIVLSSICSLIMSFIVRFVSLSERDIMAITHENNSDKRKSLAKKTELCLKIKIIILFIISGSLILLCWYYVAAFCAVFKNSQGHYLLNVLGAFIVCNLWPCVTSLIAPIFRIYSLKKKDAQCMYKFSQIIAYF